MPEWIVTLSGDDLGLRFLAELTHDGDPCIRSDDGAWRLRLSSLDAFDDVNDAKFHADLMLSTLIGIASLRLCYSPKVRVSRIQREPNQPGHTFLAGEAHFPAACLFPDMMAPIQDVTRLLSRDMLRRLLILRATYDAVEFMFLFLLRSVSSFGELYCVYELVEHDLGGESKALKFLQCNGWASRAEVKRFKRTSNSIRAAGILSRHGDLATQPPKAPMSLEDAQGLVRAIATKWLLWKCNEEDDAKGSE